MRRHSRALTANESDQRAQVHTGLASHLWPVPEPGDWSPREKAGKYH